MIAEKLENAVRMLEDAARRGNGDLEALAPSVAARLRAEIERVRGLEELCLLTPAGTGQQ